MEAPNRLSSETLEQRGSSLPSGGEESESARGEADAKTAAIVAGENPGEDESQERIGCFVALKSCVMVRIHESLKPLKANPPGLTSRGE